MPRCELIAGWVVDDEHGDGRVPDQVVREAAKNRTRDSAAPSRAGDDHRRILPCRGACHLGRQIGAATMVV